jgi:hypothetical protein
VEEEVQDQKMEEEEEGNYHQKVVEEEEPCPKLSISITYFISYSKTYPLILS